MNLNAWCIVVQGIAASRDAGRNCSSSARTFGKTINIFPATSKFKARAFWKEEEFFSRPDSFSVNTPGNGKGYWPGLEPGLENEAVMGCLASHFRLWKKCVAMQEPVLILGALHKSFASPAAGADGYEGLSGMPTCSQRVCVRIKE